MLNIWLVGDHRHYHYLDVPAHVYEQLVQAESAVAYFNHRSAPSSRCRDLLPASGAKGQAAPPVFPTE
jgi:hypothetical protein